MRISDWSSDVCSSDLLLRKNGTLRFFTHASRPTPEVDDIVISYAPPQPSRGSKSANETRSKEHVADQSKPARPEKDEGAERSEENTSELQSLMRISYAVFCLKKKTKTKYTTMIHL